MAVRLLLVYAQFAGYSTAAIENLLFLPNYSFELQDQVQIKYRLLSPIPSYDQMVKEMIDNINLNKIIYSHYLK